MIHRDRSPSISSLSLSDTVYNTNQNNDGDDGGDCGGWQHGGS